MISISPTGLGILMSYATSIFTDMEQLVFLAIGLPTGFYIARKVISLIKLR